MTDIVYHRHHLLPLHMGGLEDGPTVLLTIKQHAEAHKELWEEHGLWQDWLAWKMLSGAISQQDAIKIAIVEGGKIAAKNLAGKKRSIEACQRMSASAKRKRGGMTHLRSVEVRTKANLSNLGKKRSAATKKNISEAMIRRPKKNFVCEICGTPFMAVYAKYCSQKCNMNSYLRRLRG
jgi:hypothetical protein